MRTYNSAAYVYVRIVFNPFCTSGSWMTPYEMTQEDVIKIINVTVMWYEAEFEVDNLALRIHDNENGWRHWVVIKLCSTEKSLFLVAFSRIAGHKISIPYIEPEGFYYCNQNGLSEPVKSSLHRRGEFRPRQTRQLPRAVDLKGRLLSCQSY